MVLRRGTLQASAKRGNGARGIAPQRAAVAVILGVVPVAVVGWAGCSSSSSGGGAGLPTVDPGGTYGAEIAVTVVGRGRVTTSIPGLSCPSDCFASFVFADRNDPAAAGGVGLKAIATKGVRFAGWKFEAVSAGGRGRGPDACNPIKRDTARPSVDLNGLEITLPYGEANGTPPTGQEALCAQYTSVPVAYNVTATFVDEQIVDGGPDVDGSTVDYFINSPVAGAVAKEIGIAGSRLYWRYEQGGVSAIATASTSGTGAQTVAGTSGTFGAFEIGQHVVWHNTDNGNIGVIQGGGTSATTFSSNGNTCVAVESDVSNVFCRTAGPGGSMISWSTSGASMTTLHTGLPFGSDFTLDGSYFFLVDQTNGAGATTIRSMPRAATADAGVPAFTDLVFGLTNPTKMESNSSRHFWIADDSVGSGTAQSAPRLGGSVYSSGAATLGMNVLATDPLSSTSFFVGIAPSGAAGASQIVRLSSSSTATTIVRQNLTGLGGIAADSSYVYWTESDGRIRRAQRIGF